MRNVISKKELLLVILLLLISAVAYIAMLNLKNDDEVVALVTFDGRVVETIQLNEDNIYHIDALIPVTLEVKDGSIRFINSVCPNHDCEGFGYINALYESAICLPAKVSVQIVDNP